MKRYQVYLDPHSVSILDDFEKYTDISRSKLKDEAPKQKLILDSLVGFINLKGRKQTDYALKDDGAYLID